MKTKVAFNMVKSAMNSYDVRGNSAQRMGEDIVEAIEDGDIKDLAVESVGIRYGKTLVIKCDDGAVSYDGDLVLVIPAGHPSMKRCLRPVTSRRRPNAIR